MKPTLDEIVRWCSTNDPGLWKQCYPRIYREPIRGKYYSARMVGANIHLSTLCDASDGQLGLQRIFWAHSLIKYGCPLYWLAPEMAQAIQLTDNPGDEGIDWATERLPMEAATIMIPKGTIIHATRTTNDGVPEEAAFVSYCRLHEGSALKLGAQYSEAIRRTFAAPPDMFSIHVSVNSGAILNSAVSRHKNRSTVVTPKSMMADPVLGGEPWNETDEVFMQSCIHLLLGTLLLMTARPDLVSYGMIQQTAKVKRGTKGANEFWSPNIIGRDYQLCRESPGGSHLSPRLHWVRGFYRNQAYGKQWAYRKLVWIEPFTRGVEAA